MKAHILISTFMALALCLLKVPCAHAENNMTVDNRVKVEVKTSLGDFVVALYDETPQHRDNFVKLAEEGYYDGVLFHRVINNFMVQAGDPSSKTADSTAVLGEGDPGYTLPAEFVYPKYFHKRGALAAARTADQVNPERRSSGSQFYVVTGRVYTSAMLDDMKLRLADQRKQQLFNAMAMERIDSIQAMQGRGDMAGLQALQQELIAKTEAQYAAAPFSFTQEQIEAYTTVGGTPHLDGQYTVYGEVIQGYEVIDKIQNVETGAHDRPLADVKILSMRVIRPEKK
ncbi:MAG: peptidylprolyl isomerase [Muribaculaceae bacterium]|nr:peptidylprolyl isomerase [Muribaculaceae bacterium]MBQ2490644.1 peptidylprolyl isomerase [Muribaculaceae bacterium]MBQ4008056.1 peptidylprolyl isomerase [Muribaculaceae bacterium]